MEMMKSSYIIIDTYTPANDRVSVILELVIFLDVRSLVSHEILTGPSLCSDQYALIF